MKNTLILTDKKQGGTVKLFSRKNGLNPASLYLEIYSKVTQKRRLEFLGLYLIGDNIQDNLNIQAAKKACINYHISEEVNTQKISPNFTDFVTRRLMNIVKEQSRVNGFKALKKLQAYMGKDIMQYKDINNDVLQGFKTWLLTKCINKNTGETLSRGTADVYYVEISRAAKDAREKGYIPFTNFYPKDIKSIGRDEVEHVYLTPEQIIKLQNTVIPKGKEEICKAGILQYECGQRWCDVRSMTWEGLQNVSDNFERVFNQIKTGNLAFSAFNQNLLNWIAGGRERTGYIFKQGGRGGLPKNHQTTVEVINEWCKAAGINEYIGTHTFRRSFAKHLWLKGADIYAIMQLLGHKTIKQTQNYIGTDKDKLRQTLDLLKPITDQFSYNQNKGVTTMYKVEEKLTAIY